MTGIHDIIRRYKRRRDNRYLSNRYEKNYAMIGFGNHTIHNLFPIIQYLQIPVKYIGCSSMRKAELIGQKFQGIIGTTSIEEILHDDTIAGVFVSATPVSHFNIATQVIQSGKSLFIEKPPCMSLNELNRLIEQQERCGGHTTFVGLQKRYSPLTAKLKKELGKTAIYSYDLHYRTGLYPEGDEFYDLFIHPVDLAISLFGEGRILAAKKIQSKKKGGVTFLLMLEHGNTIGTLELSTLYSWQNASESLHINTLVGTYDVEQMEKLTFTPSARALGAIPLEKVIPVHPLKEFLFIRNNFNPILANNQIFTQGYFNELKMFADTIEGKRKPDAQTGFASLRPVYRILEELKKR